MIPRSLFAKWHRASGGEGTSGRACQPAPVCSEVGDPNCLASRRL